MDRYHSISCLSSIRGLLLSMGAAALCLYSADFTGRDFLVETRLLISDSAGLRALVVESLSSFSLIGLALLIGLSFALALTVALQSCGDFFEKIVGWLGRIIADITPIAWCFGVMIILPLVFELPIPGLLPNSVSSLNQSLSMRLGLSVWQWLVPAITLAIPIFGLALYSLTNQLCEWNHDPALRTLEARGLSRSAILYHYLMPRVWQHLGHLARPAWGLLVITAIPVEKMLGFDGWGRRLADHLLQNDTPKIAFSLILGGMLLTLGDFIIHLLSQRVSTPKEEPTHESSRSQNKSAFVVGLVLAMTLMLMPKWLPLPLLNLFQRSYEPWFHEVSLAMFSSLSAFVVIFFYSFIIGLSRKDPSRNKFASAPLLLIMLLLAGIATFLFFYKASGFIELLIVVFLIHSLITAHGVLKKMYASDRVLSARSLGRASYGVWRNHILPNLLPSLLHWIFWNTANVLLIVALIRFCIPAAAATDSWGQQMQLASDGILESPMPAFAPAILLMLWCLSFRLISRAFPVRTPSLPTSPFDAR